MLTLSESSHAKRVEGVHRHSDRRWNLIWLGFVAANGIACAVVWLNALSPHLSENGRQILAAVICAIGGVYIWRRTALLPASSCRIGEVMLVVCSVLVCIAGCLHVTRAYLMANICLLASFVIAQWGWDRGKKFLPIAFLSLFLLPDLPEEFRANLAIPFEHISTTLSVSFAKLVIPISCSGHVFYVNGFAYDVAPSCSGLGMWTCFLFTFAIWQVFKRYRLSGYLVMFLLDPILMLVLNTVRLFLTAVVGFYASQKTALAIHSNLEFVLIPLGLWLLLRAGKWFEAS